MALVEPGPARLFLGQKHKVSGRDLGEVRLGAYVLQRIASDDPALAGVIDPDGDGHDEVVSLPVSAVSRESDDLTSDIGTVLYVLDGSLRTQLRLTTDLSSLVPTAHTDCRTAWNLVDADGDGHDDVHVSNLCIQEFDMEGSGPRETSDSRTCLYVAAADEWRCAPAIATWLFDGCPASVVAETPEEAARAMRGLGSEWPARLSQARERMANETR
jgi:hypothetical protein